MKNNWVIKMLLVFALFVPYKISLAEDTSESYVSSTSYSSQVDSSIAESSESEEDTSVSSSDSLESTREETISSSSVVDTETEESSEFSNKISSLVDEKLAKQVYGTITENQTVVFNNLEQISNSAKGSIQKLNNKTYALKSTITVNGEKYYSTYDVTNQFIGYINEKSLNISSSEEGVPVSYEKFYTITSQGYTVWGNFFSNPQMKTIEIRGRVLYAKDIFYHFNGSKYLALYDNQDKFIGYLNEDGARIAQGAQGDYQSYNKYVTITSQGYTVWGGFFTNQKMLTKEIQGKTFLAKGIYRHFNGSNYLSLYDNSGNWIGYLNENGAQLAPGAQGIYQSYNKYVTITSQGYTVWGGFFTNQKMRTKNIRGKTLLAKGIYRHFNGSNYLSLYDNQGKWLGYLNENGAQLAPGAQGIYQSYGKDVYVTSKGYTVWGNFFSTKRMLTKDIYGRTLRARGIYRHYNGSNYLSLYDSAGNWIGYLNENSTKLITNNKKILDVPIIHQLPELPTGCEITAVTMLLQYHDAKVNKINLANEMPKHSSNPNIGYVGNPFTKNGWTIYPDALKSLVKKYSGSSTVLTGTNMSGLEKSIYDGKPVVVWVSMHGFSVHAITVTGLDNNNVYFNDPWTGKKNVSMSKTAFLKTWNTQQRRAISK